MSRGRRLVVVTLGLATLAAGAGAEPWRAAVTPPPEGGWQRLVLTREAQRDAESLWLSGVDGRPTPFLRLEALPSRFEPVELAGLLLGRDESGFATAEMAPVRPSAETESRALRFRFDVAADEPWVARLEVTRRSGDGEWIVRDGPALWLHDLGAASRRLEAFVQWDGERYRLRLLPLEGAALELRGLSAETDAIASAARFEEELPLAVEALEPTRAESRWRLRLPERDRVRAIELDLEPPVAPLTVLLRRPGKERGVPGPLVGRGSVWNLPALDAESGDVDLSRPTLLGELELWAPTGVRVTAARARIRREILVFPAGEGERLILHGGGDGVREAAGSLASLRIGSDLLEREPLLLGGPEPDPDGVRTAPTWEDRLRKILVPAVALVALALALLAWRLFRAEPVRRG